MTKIKYSELSTELTEEEIAELDALEDRPIVYDEDCPAMTEEMLSQFKRANVVTVCIEESNLKKVGALGKDYRNALSKLINLALNEEELVKKCI